MKKIFLGLLAALLLFSMPSAVLLAEGEGTVQGKLTNGTKDMGDKVAGVTVSLRTYVNGSPQGEPVNAVSDKEGKFQFAKLNTASTYSYDVDLFYQEAEYTTSPVSFAQGETTLPIEVTIYEATPTSEAISIKEAHMVVYFENEGLKVVEYYLVSNNSDKAFVGSKVITSDNRKETLRFPLPGGFVGLQAGEGLMDCCIVTSKAGVSDTMAVIPPTREISFSYILPYSSTDYVLSKKMEYPTTSFNFLVEDKGIKVTSSDLTEVESLAMGETTFFRFVKDSMSAGYSFSVTFTGLPSSNPQKKLWPFAIALAVLGLVAGISYPIIRSRRTVQDKQRPRFSRAEREQVLMEIARLDDDFESGKIAEERYLKLRSEKKRRLVEMEGPREKRA